MRQQPMRPAISTVSRGIPTDYGNASRRSGRCKRTGRGSTKLSGESRERNRHPGCGAVPCRSRRLDRDRACSTGTTRAHTALTAFKPRRDAHHRLRPRVQSTRVASESAAGARTGIDGDVAARAARRSSAPGGSWVRSRDARRGEVSGRGRASSAPRYLLKRSRCRANGSARRMRKPTLPWRCFPMVPRRKA